tara:strand:+ start:276 stop:443 length:168 start_codon:yes stop_codon:yes gene_type:complete
MGNRNAKLTNKELTSAVNETRLYVKNLTRLFQDYVAFRGDMDKFTEHIKKINNKE